MVRSYSPLGWWDIQVSPHDVSLIDLLVRYCCVFSNGTGAAESYATLDCSPFVRWSSLSARIALGLCYTLCCVHDG